VLLAGGRPLSTGTLMAVRVVGTREAASALLPMHGPAFLQFTAATAACSSLCLAIARMLVARASPHHRLASESMAAAQCTASLQALSHPSTKPTGQAGALKVLGQLTALCPECVT
jgi:hypothetical protein